MKTHSNFYLPLSLFLISSALLFSCQEEVPEISKVNDLSKDISLTAFDPLIKNPYTVHWADTIMGEEPLPGTARKNGSPKKLVEFPIELKGYLTLEDEVTSRKAAFFLLAEKTKGKLENLTLVKMLPTNSTVNMTGVSYLKMKDFTGTVYKYDIEGVLKAIEGFDKGVPQLVRTDFSQKPNSSGRYSYIPCNGCGGGGGGEWVDVYVRTYTDWYVSVNGGPFQYVGSDYTGAYTESVYVPDGNPHPSESQHEHTYSTSGGSGGGTPTSPHPRDVIPLTEFKVSRAGCVYRKIGSAYSFQTLIQDYQYNNYTVNLTFTVGQTNNSANAETTSSPPFNDVTITIDEDYIDSDARTIELARTLYHEAIHAHILSFLRKLGGYNHLSPNNFPSLYDTYVDRVSTGSSDPASDAQHDYMAQRYIDLIAKGVQQFDVRNKNNLEVTLDHYRALAWVGLQDTRAWNNKGQTEKDEITFMRNYLIEHFGAINCEQ